MKPLGRVIAGALISAGTAASAHASDANFIMPITNLSGYDVQVQIMPVGTASSCVAFNADYSAARTLHPFEVLPFGFYRSSDCHGHDGFIGIRVAGQHMPYQSLQDDDLQWVEFDADGGLWKNWNVASAYLNQVHGFGRVMGDTAVHEFQILPSKQIVTPPVSQQLLTSYAPLIYLHPEEQFMPSSLEYFAANVHAECAGQPIQKPILSLTAADLPSAQGTTGGNDHSATCRMTTNDPMNGPYDIKPFFHGTTPTAQAPVPVYVFIYDWQNPTTFTAQFNTFYPWNQGKMACPSFAPDDHCLSASRYEVDDHVADWELATIRFVDGRPLAVHVGAHGNKEPSMAGTYKAPSWGALQWSGTHPIIYSAVGSHGTWATEGLHNYETIATGDKLNDYTARGVAWETWRAIVMASDPKYRYLMYQFRGDWGNFHQGKDPCDASPLLGNALCRAAGVPVGEEYELNDGPSMPDTNRDRNFVGFLPDPVASGNDDLEFNGHKDGSGSFAQAPDAADLHLSSQATLEATVFWYGAPGYTALVSKPREDKPGSVGTGYTLALADGRPMFGIIAGQQNRAGAAAKLPIPRNQWVTVSATYDGKRAVTYVNGVEVARQEWPNAEAIASGPTSVLIGREFLSGLVDRAFGGRLSDVRIWNQALSPETIAIWSGKASVGAHPNRDALVARWLLNDNQGIATDVSGHNHTATLANGAVWHRE